MAQISKHLVSKAVYERMFQIFLEAISKLNSKSTASDFMKELLTPTEQIMLTKRLAICFLFAKGYTYREISEILKVSKNTIGTVSIQYKYGKTLKYMVDSLLRDEQFKIFWLEIAEAISSMGTIGRKGTSGWKYLNKEIKNRLDNKPF